MGRRSKNNSGMKFPDPCNNKATSEDAATTRMSTVGEEHGEATEEMMEVERAESSNVVEDASDGQTLIGSEKTSADYYFDSYSHFGIHEYVTANGCKNLTNCPRKTYEIEAVMAGAPWLPNSGSSEFRTENGPS